ncbi:hypothetical protein [Halomarina rubra]|uniref:Uncharacterized protein n=1 Tax=Halomarina rubra TaxID=2071873 RepID=A0ABD6AYH5_9EURY|nr:hypothetical protein [Halomarina rubra]
MSDSDIAEEVDIEEVESGGGKIKRIVGALGLLAVLFVVLKLKGRGSSGPDATTDDTSSAVGSVDDDEAGIDTVSTKDDDDDDGLEVKTSSGQGLGGDRFEDLDLVDYLAIFAAALQAARDEYRIRSDR